MLTLYEYYIALITGGRVDDQCSLADVERYNSNTDEWEEVSPLSDARRGVAIATHEGKLYAIGGSGMMMTMAITTMMNDDDDDDNDDDDEDDDDDDDDNDDNDDNE